ncbi:MAG: hypothetical protein JNK09_01880 [Prolixibacteraceae bacterium]|nr:hypothetical protein [Prolixibacteraceae bacterium]
MNQDALRFISEIVKPWETLNQELSRPFSLNIEINDYITKSINLAVTIKHFPEATQRIKSQTLVSESFDYSVISDLADSMKHGELRNPERECKLTVSSMFERNQEAKVRFLRNRISITHNNYGKVDFMQCSMNSAIFIMQKLGIKTNWTPKIFNNSGAFSDEIKVHASKNNQIVWADMELEIVQLNDKNEYENIDLSGTVKFILTSEF